MRAVVLLIALVGITPVRATNSSDPKPASGPITTGTPSNGNATVSAATVADAATRADQLDGDHAKFDLSLGTTIASGDFGSGQNSRIISAALGGRYTIGTLRLSASVPYLNVRSRGTIFSGIDGTPIVAAPGKPGPAATARGIGDLTVGAAYTLPQSGSGFEIELSGRVKIPTATKSSQLSTGKTDVSGGIQITKVYGRFAPFISGTYRVFGDPAAINLKDGFAASAGTSYALSGQTVVLASYHYAAAVTNLMRDSHEMFAGISGRLPGGVLRLTGFVTAGLSSGAAANSGGLSLSAEF